MSSCKSIRIACIHLLGGEKSKNTHTGAKNEKKDEKENKVASIAGTDGLQTHSTNYEMPQQ